MTPDIFLVSLLFIKVCYVLKQQVDFSSQLERKSTIVYQRFFMRMPL